MAESSRPVNFVEGEQAAASAGNGAVPPRNCQSQRAAPPVRGQGGDGNAATEVSAAGGESPHREPLPTDVVNLVREHHAAVYRYAFRLTGREQDAEDLSQQTFLIAQEKIGQLRNPEAARSWLFSVLRRCFLKEVRRNEPQLAVNLEMDVEHVPDTLPTDEIDREALQSALNELPSEFREVLVMFYFEFCSYKEIAEQLEIPPGTVMSRLSRGKNWLRRRLTSEPIESTQGRG